MLRTARLAGRSGGVVELRNVLFSQSTAPGLLNETRLDSAARWAAGGFTALGAVLTFFGIREGLLDRLLRADATSALLVFCFLGLGAICSLIAPAFEPNVRIRATWGVFAVISLGCLTWWHFPDLGEDAGMNRLTWTLFAGACLLALCLWKTPLSLIAAVLVIGVASVSFGLYGTAKLSLRFKRFPDTPRITASFDGEAQHTVKVGVLASKRENEQVVVTLRGLADGAPGQDGDVVIGQARLPADATGEINSTLVFPVDRTAWAALTVGYCTVPDGGAPACAPVSARLPGLRGQGSRGINASIRPGPAAGVAAQLAASGMLPGSVLRVSLSRVRRGGELRVAFATVSPTAEGTADWSLVTSGGAPGDRYLIRYRVCTRMDRGCDPVAREAASYVLLGR